MPTVVLKDTHSVKAPRPTEVTPKRVLIVCATGNGLFMKAIPQLIFEVANQLGAPYTAEFCDLVEAKENGECVEGFANDADRERLSLADIVIVPYWSELERRPSVALAEGLRAHYAQGKILAGLCYGAFALAHAGILDGKEAVTHWTSVETFETLFPKVTLNTDALYCESGGVFTSAGVTAGIDCCLYLIRRLHGSLFANEIARLIVAAPFRDGGQLQFIQMPVPSSTQDRRINHVLQTLETQFTQPIDWDQLAADCAMSPRTFYRAFQRATGVSPAQWIRVRRLEKATTLLEASRLNVDEIALDCGFDSTVTFRQAFHKHYGVSPTQWRSHFRGGEELSSSE